MAREGSGTASSGRDERAETGLSGATGASGASGANGAARTGTSGSGETRASGAARTGTSGSGAAIMTDGSVKAAAATAPVAAAKPRLPRRWKPILLAVVGAAALIGGGVALVLGLRGRDDGTVSAEREKKTGGEEEEVPTFSIPEFEGGDVPENEASGVMRGANKLIADEEIVRERRFYGVAYSPYGLGDNRLCPPFDDVGKQCLMTDQVLADVRLLSTVTNRIRLYSLLCVEAMDAILTYCVKEKIEVSLGVWVNKIDAANKAELARLQAVLDKYGKTGIIKDVVVGNEAIFVVGVPIAVLAAEMKLVRKMLKAAGSDAKIGTAEIYNMWKGKETADIEGDQFSLDGTLDMTPIVEQSDWIGLNTHSYYGGVSGSSGDAGMYARNEWADIQGEFGKPVTITETGYPTRGDIRTTDFGTAVPGEKELELFASQVEEKSRENGFAVYFFEFADADWKRRWDPFHEADYSFGLFTCDRKPKNLKLPPVGAL